MTAEMTPRARKMLILESTRLQMTTTTMGVPSSIQADLRSRYPTLELRRDPTNHRFLLCEMYDMGAHRLLRKLWVYENPDGTKTPIVLQVLLDWCLDADTRRWPIVDRMKLWIKEADDDVKKHAAQQRQDRIDAVLEDYDYIAGIKTFFMDPSSMPERITKTTPYQDRALKKLQLAGAT